ncbi:hypothetical protein [Idiomarina aquatica]|jgi:hypothetical protein|uniref:Uncharacterized protein n=1 Tax=Idiomarina aquatica TaxID=1327752 RepID=A0AA94EG60_9GAMM|nr:hypothetical protein [Idiomarina aquatica]RUO44652.1 hypothetical protein CWE23_01040 [Idiomarina aquatica]
MIPAELLVVALCLVMILVSYLHVYPKVAGSNFNKLAAYDLIAAGIALFIVGYKYWDTGFPFYLLGLSLNWFWYTLIVYIVLETPVALWYIKKHNIRFK